jgi:hypothetical protein
MVKWSRRARTPANLKVVVVGGAKRTSGEQIKHINAHELQQPLHHLLTLQVKTKVPQGE